MIKEKGQLPKKGWLTVEKAPVRSGPLGQPGVEVIGEVKGRVPYLPASRTVLNGIESYYVLERGWVSRPVGKRGKNSFI
jgi:hypothetical protein